MNYKQLKKENKKLKRKLNIANNTVYTQIEEINSLNDRIINKSILFRSSIELNSKRYEEQLEVQDKELSRRLTIIRYLEEKCLRVFNDNVYDTK